jgi:hypothetical protein
MDNHFSGIPRVASGTLSGLIDWVVTMPTTTARTRKGRESMLGSVFYTVKLDGTRVKTRCNDATLVYGCTIRLLISSESPVRAGNEIMI